MRQGCVAGGGIFRCNVPDVNAAGSHGTGWHCMRVFRAGVRHAGVRRAGGAVRAVPGRGMQGVCAGQHSPGRPKSQARYAGGCCCMLFFTNHTLCP